LFANDTFGKDDWVMTFTLRLLYRDTGLEVRRVNANADQQPRPDETQFDHAFASVGTRFEELDNRDLKRSVELHILKDGSLGREVVFSKPGHGAYVVSGVKDFEGPDEGRWTGDQATLKFQLPPADSQFAVKYFLPDAIAKAGERTLTVTIRGAEVGQAKLTNGGAQAVRFAVPSRLISADGYTLVDLKIAPPFVDEYGVALGFVLMQAGFDAIP
jgi:hypothetical protein